MAGIESLLIGRVLGGRYRIEEVIGRGGMGAVYRALDERLGRLVALKVITVAGSGDAEGRERLRARFFREARSAAALPHHPNVVPVYDYGSDEDVGLDYLVMELLRGSDLATRLARTGPPPLAAALKILLEAARGIAVGHRQGLIHRDVKPGNIFLTEPHRNEVQVRMVDFGIAKLADEDDTLAQLTQDGRVPHSPAYASPEQLRGLSNLTPASDVFSLGAVGYQLLAGERPFTEDDRNKLSLGMAAEPRPLRQLNPAIPGSIEAVILRALSIDPEQRFSDAGEMAQELERAIGMMQDMPIEPYLAGAAIVTGADGEEETRSGEATEEDRTRLVDEPDDRTLLAPPPAPAPTGAKSRASAPPPAKPTAIPPTAARRTRRGIGGILVWSLVFAVLGLAGLWAWSDMTRSPDFSGVFPMPPDTLIIPPPDSVSMDTAGSRILDAELANVEGTRYFRAGDFASAYEQFSIAVQIAPNVPEYHRNLGLVLNRIGDYVSAEREFARAIQLAPSSAAPYLNRSQSQLALGDTVAAIESLEDYLDRETDPVQRGLYQRNLVALRRSQEVELLGEPVDSANVDPRPVPTNPGDGITPQVTTPPN